MGENLKQRLGKGTCRGGGGGSESPGAALHLTALTSQVPFSTQGRSDSQGHLASSRRFWLEPDSRLPKPTPRFSAGTLGFRGVTSGADSAAAKATARKARGSHCHPYQFSSVPSPRWRGWMSYRTLLHYLGCRFNWWGGPSQYRVSWEATGSHAPAAAPD